MSTLPDSRTYPTRGLFLVGDSKSTGDIGDTILYEFRDLSRGVYLEDPLRYAVSGLDTLTAAAQIDGILAARAATPVPTLCLVNLGANDLPPGFADGGTAWRAAMAYILDAIHTKWATTPCYVMRVWRRSYSTAYTLLDDTLIPAVLVGRSWVHLGPDERSFLENGDDGVTYTGDGTHPNAAGKIVTAQQWRIAAGY